MRFPPEKGGKRETQPTGKGLIPKTFIKKHSTMVDQTDPVSKDGISEALIVVTSESDTESQVGIATSDGSSKGIMYNRFEILCFLLASTNALCIVCQMNRRAKIICRLQKESQHALVLLSELNSVMLRMIMSVFFLVVALALGMMTVMIEYGWLTLE